MLILPGIVFAQVEIINAERTNFKIPSASFYEPRVGVMRYFERNSLKVDIGNSLDIVRINSSGKKITLGVDFFAYTLVNNASFLILRVEALDGFFGGNLSVSGDDFSLRFRVLHRSAHLVDEFGELGKKPFPFTREFFDLVFARSWKSFRIYGGIAYVFRAKPREGQRFYVQNGVEYFTKLIEKFLGINSPISAFVSSDLKFFDSSFNIAFAGGLKFGQWDERGVAIYSVYYNGFDIYGQYFKERKRFSGVGFYFDL